MKATARQLDLPCTFEQATALQEQLDRLNGLCALLYDEKNRLQDQLDSAQAEIAILKTNLDVARFAVFNRAPTLPDWLSGELRRLVVLSHPDRWGAGQHAATLAHEVTVALNALRERLEEVLP